MTDRDELHTLRTSAKRLARALRLPHHQALDIVATRCGQPHWNALMAAWANGWRPTTEQTEVLRKPEAADTPSRGVSSVSASEGVIAGEPYQLDVGFDYVLIGGRGWAIHLGHAPSKAAEIEKYTSPNPLDNEAFLKEVMKVAQKAADRVREAIAQDWPRRSTKPDKDGCAVHPLFGGVSADWYCLHCDARFTGVGYGKQHVALSEMQCDSARYASERVVERASRSSGSQKTDARSVELARSIELAACPLWVKRRNSGVTGARLLWPQKPTPHC